MANPARVVLATANPNKVRELKELLGQRFVVEERPPGLAETIEDGETLEANALKKAREVAEAAGAAALADDTGLFVDALHGRPGVHTARFAGADATSDDNIDKLLADLAAQPDRSAHFRTVMAMVWPDGRQLVADGRVEGTILAERAGDAGFGYDPIFCPSEGDGRSFAQMSSVEKHALSHRGRALLALREALRTEGLSPG